MTFADLMITGTPRGKGRITKGNKGPLLSSQILMSKVKKQENKDSFTLLKNNKINND